MSKVRVALLQIAACGKNQAANREKGVRFCRIAAEQGADVIVFPEMWNIGYQGYMYGQPGALDQWVQQAVGRDDEYMRTMCELARELQVAIAFTYLERWESAMPRNAVSIIDRHGEFALTYAKVHTCDFNVHIGGYVVPEAACTPGDDFYVCTLDTRVGKVNIGAMICFDREFPESARILMLKGAEIILTPNACFLDDQRLHQFQTRAFENMVGVAMANYPAPSYNGHSIAFDVDGSLIVDAGENEGIAMAEFDLDKMRQWRAKNIWGNAFRRPHRYQELASLNVTEPFIRKNGFAQPFERQKR